MWGHGFWYGAYWMWRGIFVDVLIVIGVTAVAGQITGMPSLRPPTWRGWMALLAIGFLNSVPLEWIPRSRGLWQYTAWMPVMNIFGLEIGLLPVAQITFLPALSFHLAIRKKTKTATQSR
jgi:hypothetical protein